MKVLVTPGNGAAERFSSPGQSVTMARRRRSIDIRTTDQSTLSAFWKCPVDSSEEVGVREMQVPRSRRDVSSGTSNTEQRGCPGRGARGSWPRCDTNGLDGADLPHSPKSHFLADGVHYGGLRACAHRRTSTRRQPYARCQAQSALRRVSFFILLGKVSETCV